MKKRLMLLTLVQFLVFGLFSPLHATLIDNGDGTVTDDDTELMWLKESLPTANRQESELTWKEAMFWAYNLDFAGYQDWRLPSALEINLGIVDLAWNGYNNEWAHLYGTEWGNPANSSHILPMEGYPCCWYWTSTEDPGNPTRAAAFFVSYDNRWLNLLHDRNIQMRYTAVRGAPKPDKAPQCNDGYDNDGNGLVDYPADSGCDSAEDTWEYTCGWWGCLFKMTPYPCIKIDDSWFCFEFYHRLIIFGVIVGVMATLWWMRKRKKALPG